MILNTKFIKCNLQYDIDEDNFYYELDIYSKIKKLNAKINKYQKSKFLRLLKKYNLLKYANSFLKLNPTVCSCGNVTCGMNRVSMIKTKAPTLSSYHKSKCKSLGQGKKKHIANKHKPLSFEKLIKKYSSIIKSNSSIEDKLKVASKLKNKAYKKVFMELIAGLLHTESFNLDSIKATEDEIEKINNDFFLKVKDSKKDTFVGLGLHKEGTIFTWKNIKTNETGICVIGTDAYGYSFNKDYIITSYCNTLLKLDIIK